MCQLDESVTQLREKRAHWTDCLVSDDVNSIQNQLTRMTWNITVFRVLMEEALPRAPDAEGGGKQLNGPLLRLLQESFLESLLLGFRRLMDRGGLDGDRGVNSLRSLLDDISEHSHLLTRGAIIQLGPPDTMNSGNRGGDFLHAWADTKHRQIDNLTGLAEDPDDRIPRHLFDDRRKTLETDFESAKAMINQEIAHAATPQSRSRFHYQRITWDDLYKLHAELCKSAHFLDRLICESGLGSFLPIQIGGGEVDYLSRTNVAARATGLPQENTFELKEVRMRSP